MDYLIRGLTEGGRARFASAVITDVAREACRRHATQRGSARVLAETLTATALLGPNLKADQKLSMQLTGDGPVRGVMADIDSEGHLRGMVENPMVGGDIGVGAGGLISVMRSTTQRVMSQGSVPIVSGDEVAPNVVAYLTASEQVKCAVSIRTFFQDASLLWAGGLLIEHMPGEDPSVFETLKTILMLPDFETRLAHDFTPEDIVHLAIGETPIHYKVLDTLPLKFQCACSRPKVADMLGMLTNDELQKMKEEDGGAEVTCRFCNEVYRLDSEELSILMANSGEVN